MRKMLGIATVFICIVGAGLFFQNYLYFEKTKTETGARELALAYFLQSVENTQQPKLINLASQAKCEIVPTLAKQNETIRYIANCKIPTNCLDPIEMPVYVMNNGIVGNPSGSVSQALLARCPTMIDDVSNLKLPDNWQEGG